MANGNTGSEFWGSSSTFGDSHVNGCFSDSSSRWECEETPTFPRPFSALISPRLPQRQRTNESQQFDDGDSDMIDMMMEEEEALAEESSSAATTAAFQRDLTDTCYSPQDCLLIVGSSCSGGDPATLDCPKQSMAPPRLPKRQLSNMVANFGRDRPRLLQMRLRSMQRVQDRHHEQQDVQEQPQYHQSARPCRRSLLRSSKSIDTSNHRTPERQNGFYDFKRSTTI